MCIESKVEHRTSWYLVWVILACVLIQISFLYSSFQNHEMDALVFSRLSCLLGMYTFSSVTVTTRHLIGSKMITWFHTMLKIKNFPAFIHGFSSSLHSLLNTRSTYIASNGCILIRCISYSNSTDRHRKGKRQWTERTKENLSYKCGMWWRYLAPFPRSVRTYKDVSPWQRHQRRITWYCSGSRLGGGGSCAGCRPLIWMTVPPCTISIVNSLSGRVAGAWDAAECRLSSSSVCWAASPCALSWAITSSRLHQTC